ncbi:hypothetical protein PC128_g7941 [Phytophthora cactorum]|nr:hypothetical protein PC128_g7941 [Phytophthora cactorum]
MLLHLTQVPTNHQQFPKPVRRLETPLLVVILFHNANTEDRRSLELLLSLTLLSMELKRRIYAKSVGNVQAKADLENLRKTLYERISVNIKMSNPVLWQG